MKRKVLCCFSFLLLLFVFFTLISAKVEEEMLTLVVDKSGEAINFKSFKIANIAVNWPNGTERLYIITEGEGWEDGLRISEPSPEYYDRQGDYITLGPGAKYWYVFSASREPVLGSEVRVVETWREPDDYLIWTPEPIGDPARLPSSMSVTAASGNAVLVSIRTTTFPFFEHNLGYTLRDSFGDEVRIYSLHDIRQFAESLPWIAGIAAALLCSMLLLGVLWRLSGPRGGRRILVANLFLIALLLAAVPLLAKQFDLPASLMPQAYILDIPHYAETFGRINAALDEMGVTTVREAFSRAGRLSAVIAGSNVLATGLIIVLEHRLCTGPR